MKNKIDIYLGIGAWLVALLTPLAEFTLVIPYPYSSEFEDWVVPLAWPILVLAMIVFKRRPLRKLWWVWLSAPFAYLFWIGGLMMFIAWSTNGFAP